MATCCRIVGIQGLCSLKMRTHRVSRNRPHPDCVSTRNNLDRCEYGDADMLSDFALLRVISAKSDSISSFVSATTEARPRAPPGASSSAGGIQPARSLSPPNSTTRVAISLTHPRGAAQMRENGHAK